MVIIFIGTFNKGSKSFVVSVKVCGTGPCPYESIDYCVDKNSKDLTSAQKKDILYPSQFGYIFDKTEANNVEISIDTRSLTTALAVNMVLNITTTTIIIIIIIIM